MPWLQAILTYFVPFIKTKNNVFLFTLQQRLVFIENSQNKAYVILDGLQVYTTSLTPFTETKNHTVTAQCFSHSGVHCMVATHSSGWGSSLRSAPNDILSGL